jgi:hypothetical protein
VVKRGTNPSRPWIVFDRHLNVTHSDWTRKEAAKNRCRTLNAGWTQ